MHIKLIQLQQVPFPPIHMLKPSNPPTPPSTNQNYPHKGLLPPRLPSVIPILNNRVVLFPTQWAERFGFFYLLVTYWAETHVPAGEEDAFTFVC